MQDEETSLFGRARDQKTDDAILQISKWTRLTAMCGFSISACVVVVMLIAGAQVLQQFASFFPIKGTGIYAALVVAFFLIFFITALVLYYLYKTSRLLLQGVQQKNNSMLAEGFRFLKKFFIVVLILCILQLFTNLWGLL